MDILRGVTQHIEKSVGKLGCFQQIIPMKFVNDSREVAYENFVEVLEHSCLMIEKRILSSYFVKQRFNSLTVESYCLRKIDDWWFLVYDENASIARLYDGNCSFSLK